MSLSIDVRLETREVTRFLRILDRRSVRHATRRALNKASEQVRTQASKSIRKQRNLKVKTINDQLTVHRASMARLQASVEVTGKEIAIQHYGAKPRQVKVGGRAYKGVSVAVDRGKRKVVRGAFFGLSGNIFQRLGKARLPIGEKAKGVKSRLLGPSLSTAFLRDEIVKAMRGRVGRAYPRLLRHEVEREIAKAAR